MPPKVKTESIELQVFNLEKFSVAQLPELQGKKEEINAVIELNPIVDIIDTATYESAKKSRTAVKTLRTGLEKEQDEVKRKIKTHILDVVDKEYDLLILDVKKQENDRQNPIKIYENELEAKRQEKARIEQERIDAIKKELEDYVTEWKNAFNTMTFDSITDVSANFLESYTSFDTTILQEFEALFPVKVEELTQYLSDRTVSLTNAENARLENIRLEEEATELRAEKARLEALARIAEAAEAKAKKEREDFEKEKAEFAEKQAIAAKKEIFEKRKQILLNLGFTYEINREYNFSLDGIWSCFHEQIEDCNNEWFEEYLLDIKDAISKKTVETPPSEKVEIPEILVAEIPTVNVCTPLITEREEVKNVPASLAETPLTPEECIAPPTWESIFEEFTTSGGRSFSKWLKDNYNPPTKIQ